MSIKYFKCSKIRTNKWWFLHIEVQLNFLLSDHDDHFDVYQSKSKISKLKCQKKWKPGMLQELINFIFGLFNFSSVLSRHQKRNANFLCVASVINTLSYPKKVKGAWGRWRLRHLTFPFEEIFNLGLILTQKSIFSNYCMRLSRMWRIMQIENI